MINFTEQICKIYLSSFTYSCTLWMLSSAERRFSEVRGLVWVLSISSRGKDKPPKPPHCNICDNYVSAEINRISNPLILPSYNLLCQKYIWASNKIINKALSQLLTSSPDQSQTGFSAWTWGYSSITDVYQRFSPVLVTPCSKIINTILGRISPSKFYCNFL